MSPRIGAIYYLPNTRTGLRASFNRLFMPPQIENLLIASSQQARALSPFNSSGGGAEIRPETLSAWEVGFSQELPKSLRLNVAYWWRRFRNIDDPNVLLSTTIIFPNSVSRAEAQGLDVRLDIPIRKGFSAYASYTNNHIVEIGPINGGMFLDDDFIEIGPDTLHPTTTSAMSPLSGLLCGARGIWTFQADSRAAFPLNFLILTERCTHFPAPSWSTLTREESNPGMCSDGQAGWILSTKSTSPWARRLMFRTPPTVHLHSIGQSVFGTHFGYPRLIAGSLKFSFSK